MSAESREIRSERAKLERVLKLQLGPVSWAQHFRRYLELRGVSLGRGTRNDLVEIRGTSASVAEVAAELGVAERTARWRLELAADLDEFPKLAAKVDAGELSPAAARREAGVVKTPKPDLGDGVSHPARFSNELISVFADALTGCERVLDPFAGTGRIHDLVEYGYETVGVEIEPEWAALDDRTIVGDALQLDFDDGSFDAICTSPTYGNRMADHHDAKDGSHRRSYRHDLGRPLHPHNSGRLQWGAAYREFHVRAWKEALRVLRWEGKFVLNVKDHMRDHERQHVAGWHVTVLNRLGLRLLDHDTVPTPAMGFGENSDQRFPEQVYVFAKRVEEWESDL